MFLLKSASENTPAPYFSCTFISTSLLIHFLIYLFIIKTSWFSTCILMQLSHVIRVGYFSEKFGSLNTEINFLVKIRVSCVFPSFLRFPGPQIFQTAKSNIVTSLMKWSILMNAIYHLEYEL